MTIVEQPSPSRQRRPGPNRLKLHLRQLTIGATTYRLITLRPATAVSFSTNLDRDTWHILSDLRGARLLARLLWDLAYQREPGTMVLIYGRHLRPTPFDADPSDPILLIPAHLTGPDAKAFRQLKSRLGRLGPPQQTIRWQTFGMDAALEGNPDPFGYRRWEAIRDPARREAMRVHAQREKMCRCGGFVCYTASPGILREEALAVYHLRPEFDGMGYHFLAREDGEVQIFADYHRRLSEAAQARRDVLARIGMMPDPEAFHEEVWHRRNEIRARRTDGRERRER
jgi:hypothetical protein